MADAVIVGGGIGGLATALTLMDIGYDVRVLERAPSIGEVGAGIQISANGYRVLERIGVAAHLREVAYQPEVIEMRMGQSGRRLVTIPMGATATARWGAPYLQVHRADLIDVLRAAVEERDPGAIRTAAEVTGIDQASDRIAAVMSDGTAIAGDILIGADGLRSVVRREMFGIDAPEFTGVVAWRTTAPRAALGDVDLPNGACIWTGPDRHAVTYPVRGGEMINFVGMIEGDDWRGEGWSEPGARTDLVAHFAGWAEPLQAVIRAADDPFRWALFSRAPLPAWSSGRAVLLGDACHPMLPSLAQGACQALEDAAALADALSAAVPEAAFDTYFNRRSARAARVQREARANLRRFHWSSDLQSLPVRILAAIAPGWFHRRLDWLYRG
ncbi:MAG: FAD-dependent monooxygenase [Pseudomonadota bacterium]